MLFVFVEYLCNNCPKIRTKRFKNYISILAIANYRKIGWVLYLLDFKKFSAHLCCKEVFKILLFDKNFHEVLLKFESWPETNQNKISASLISLFSCNYEIRQHASLLKPQLKFYILKSTEKFSTTVTLHFTHLYAFQWESK